MKIDHKQKLKKSAVGKIKSKETIEKIKNTKKGCKVWNEGIPCSEQTKLNIANAKLKNSFIKKNIIFYMWIIYYINNN